jgi:hypothetical protein
MVRSQIPNNQEEIPINQIPRFKRPKNLPISDFCSLFMTYPPFLEISPAGTGMLTFTQLDAYP